MATFEEEKQHRDLLRTQLDQLIAIDAGSLDRVNELGQSLNFRQGQSYFQRALRLFRDLGEANLDELPLQTLQALMNVSQEANTYFSQIQDFSLEAHPEQPALARDGLLNAIRDQYDG